MIDVSENEQSLLKFTQDSKFHTQPALEDLSFQAQICIDPELRTPAEIRTKPIFAHWRERTKPLFFRILESEKQTNKKTNVYIVTLYLKISSFFFLFFFCVHT